ncbi:expressed unknown protein [Seminavis robusta]|uniref:CRAL-TRIO domain-containing protein n=1 Tax=Seminavis robusta TaxID=568900 RepID=A0A9N8EH14_9STRA|nr:expressed unknown protein [Seminavis robusta]|eukprot:Sro982_g227710.1 n/a (328) ;mRNA; r:24159-25230
MNEVGHPVVGPRLDEETEGYHSDEGHSSDEDDADGHDDHEEAQEEGEDIEDEDTLPPVLGPFHPARMELSTEVSEWAMEIKTAMKQSPEVDCPNDYWIAQWAIVEDNLDCAINRAVQMQHYREAYDISDTYQFGSKCLMDVMDLFPGLLLSFSFNHLDGNYAIVEDLAKFDISALRDPVKGKVWMRAAYFLQHCLCCDFEAILRGIIIIHEFDSFDWKKNIDLKALRQLWTELSLDYPMKVHRFLNYHCGFFANLTVSMAKQFLPREISDKFVMGLQMEGRLDTIYNVPNAEIAQQRVLARLQDALKRRYHHEATFTLPSGTGIPTV